jgi:2-polyprenyl-3-methyl-5-hydroxy-6-metoxy-1,4-benzoquinol methylase
MNNNQRLYNDRAQSYADEWYTNETMLPTIKDFLRTINIKNPKIIDLGCGPGNESMRLNHEGADVTGIDFSDKCIKIAREKNPKLKFYEMDYFDLNDTIGKYDGIFACSSLIHLNEEKLEMLLSVLKSVLKENGYILDIYMLGDGQRITYPKINGEEVERICERRQPEKLKDLYLRNGYKFIKDTVIDSSIAENWRASLFQYCK